MLIKRLEKLITSAVSLKAFLIDLIVIAVIYFLPAFSHIINFPLYLIEPLRIAVVFCLLHTNKRNALFVALTVPLFSFFISSHPAILKSALIIAELLINLFLFYFLVRKQNIFLSMFLSIIISKIFYYSIKFILIQVNLMDGSLVSTPIYIQWVVAIGLSLYAVLTFNNTELLET